MIHLQTERLIIRNIEERDVDGIFALDSDPEVLRFIGTPVMQHRSEAENVIAHIHKQYKENGIGRWAMEERTSGAFIGWTGLKLEKSVRPFHYYDLGYRLIRTFWGQGFATEAAQACLQHGFDVLNYPEINAAAEAEHHASNRVLKKIGMEQGEPFKFEEKLCNWYSKKRIN